MNTSSILIYQNKDGNIKIDVRLEEETVWLTQAQMAQLFGKDKRTISEHISNIFKEGELEENSVVRNFRITATDGKNYDTHTTTSTSSSPSATASNPLKAPNSAFGPSSVSLLEPKHHAQTNCHDEYDPRRVLRPHSRDRR